MPSVFDDVRPVLAPPTWDELEERLGEPLLSFEVGDPDIAVPQGLLACCHVLHQPHCRHHVALSLVGCRYAIALADGSIQEREALRRVHEGDVLARPRDLKAAVESARFTAEATAGELGGRLAALGYDIWAMDLETAEIWRYLSRERDAYIGALISASDDVPEEAIAALPVRALDPEDRPAVAAVMARLSFRAVHAYAHRVTILPSEIGHDDAARYITSVVWGTPGDVSPAAEALMRDPTETEAAP